MEQADAKNIYRRKLAVRVAMGLVIVAAVALIVRFTIRDSIPLVATLFYATPLCVVAAMLAAASVGFGVVRRRIAASLAGVAATVLLAVFLRANWGAAPQVPFPSEMPMPTVRIGTWNICGSYTREAVERLINAERLDLLTLVEANSKRIDPHEFAPRGDARWQVAIGEGDGLLIVTRGRIEATECGKLGRNGRFLRVSVVIDDRRIVAYAIDMPSNPLADRGAALRDLADRVRRECMDPVENDGPAVVVMGDFNTPPDSVHFDPLRRLLRLACEQAGRGYLPTWPVPMPVLVLDQIWCSDGLTPIESRALQTWGSDHRPSVATFGVNALRRVTD